MSIPHQARQLHAQIGRMTGRRYDIKLDTLDERSLQELSRLLRDVEFDKMAAVKRAQMQAWRRA